MTTRPRHTNEVVAPPFVDTMLRTVLNRQSAEAARTDDQRRREIDDIDERKIELTTLRQINGDQILPNIGSWDFYFVSTATSSVTLTLPDVEVSEGKLLSVKKLSAAGTLTLRAAGGLIDGAATLAWTTQYLSYSLVAAGGNWWIF